jgi:hypothetical protein
VDCLTLLHHVLLQALRNGGLASLHQRAAVHAESTSGGRDIAVVLTQYKLDVFPLQIIDFRGLHLYGRKEETGSGQKTEMGSSLAK